MQVGNAVTDNYRDSIGTVTYWWSHSMISDRTYRSILKNCNFKEDNKTSKRCDDSVNYAINHEFGYIDQYSIYTPACIQLKNVTTAVRSLRLRNSLLQRRVSGYDPCSENYAEKYFNRPDVQKAMHANVTGIPYKWTACRYFTYMLIYIHMHIHTYMYIYIYLKDVISRCDAMIRNFIHHIIFSSLYASLPSRRDENEVLKIKG